MASRTQAWYLAEKNKSHKTLYQTVSQIRSKQISYREEFKHFQRLYHNYNTTATGGYYAFANGRLRFNVVAAMVDTAASILCANRPVPFFQTSLGNWGLQRKAKRRGAVVASQYFDLGVFDIGPKVIYDGLIGGLGVVRGYVDPATGVPKLERVRPLALVMDHDEAINGNPRNAYLIHLVDREVLQAMYPRAKAALEKADGPGPMDRADFDLRRDTVTADQVVVIESWHLPSIEGWDDGRHVIAASNVTLVDEKYEKQRFPLATYQGWRFRDGYVGVGLAERCASEQAEINEIVAHRQALRQLGTNAFVGLEANSQVTPEQVTNLPMQVYRYNETPPIFHQFDAVPPGLAQEIDAIVQRILFREGLTESTVEGAKQSGASSAVAIRATDDIQSRRQLLPIREVESFYMQVGQLICDLNDECAEEDKNYAVTMRVRKARTTFLQSSQWTELDIPQKDVRCQVFPISAMPTTPQGKWSASDEWVQRGWIDKGFAMELMQFPDLDAFASLETAELDLTCSDLESILDGEWGIIPDPLQLKVACVKTAKDYYFRAKVSKASESVLKGLRNYIQAAKKLADQEAAASQMSAPPPQAPGPMTNPLMPGVSDV